MSAWAIQADHFATARMMQLLYFHAMSSRALRALQGAFPVFLAVGTFAQANTYRIAPPEPWVIEHTIGEQGVTDTACLQWGEEALLLDRQYDLADQRVYWRNARRLISMEGVQNGSRFEVSFDPTYQQLTIHHLRILRNGQVIDKLKESALRVLHREEDLRSHLYDGSLTVVGELDDVRAGDIIDHALTIRGWNPVDQGRFHKYLAMGFSYPVARSHTRLIIPDGRNPTIAYYDLEDRPTEKKTAHGRELTWDLGPLECIRVDDNVPGWHKTYPAIDVSEFGTIEDLRRWAHEQYDIDHPISAELADRIADLRAVENVLDRVDSAVHFVQQEVRYLGLEDGISAYRPHAPSKVLQQRYGDCKDKSLLLATILRGAGVEAFPALVNTVMGRSLDQWLPRPSLFDHCILMVPLQGDTLWVDATSGHNGGTGRERYTPNYGKALVVGKNFVGYTSMVVPDTGSVDIIEHIVLNEVGGQGELQVESIYRGGRADGMRSQLASTSLRDMAKDYRDFYAGIYGPCTEMESLRFEDDKRINVLRTFEHYRLEQPWDTIEDGSMLGFELNAYHVRSHQSYPGRSLRTAPYYLGEPLRVRHRITVALPEPWSLLNEELEHIGHGVHYVKTITVLDERNVALDYSYTSTLPEIAAHEAIALQDLQELIGDDLYYTFTWPLSGSRGATTGFGWDKWLFILFSIGVSVFGALRLYRYDPEPHPDSLGKPSRTIGSFLILPAIGISLTPLRFLYDMFSDDAAFFHATDYVQVADPENPLFADLSIHLSQFVTFAQLALVVVVIILFFQRRSSAPLLIMVMYGFSAVWVFMDHLIYMALGFDKLGPDPDQYRDVSRAFVAACIWIPVFHFSRRVHTTFTERLNQKGSKQTVADLPPQTSADTQVNA